MEAEKSAHDETQKALDGAVGAHEQTVKDLQDESAAHEHTQQQLSTAWEEKEKADKELEQTNTKLSEEIAKRDEFEAKVTHGDQALFAEHANMTEECEKLQAKLEQMLASRGVVRLKRMSDIYKSFDEQGDGENDGNISMEEFMSVGQALHDGEWTEEQNKALHDHMDKDHDGVVALDEFLDFYKGAIYDVDDEQFEDGYQTFLDAVKKQYKILHATDEEEKAAGRAALTADHTASTKKVAALKRQLGALQKLMDGILEGRAKIRSDRMRTIFLMFDEEGDGFGDGNISLKEFMAIGRALHDGEWTKEQNKALHDHMDKDHDGVVALDEFLDFYKGAIYDVDDEQFEDGYQTFLDAVKKQWLIQQNEIREKDAMERKKLEMEFAAKQREREREMEQKEMERDKRFNDRENQLRLQVAASETDQRKAEWKTDKLVNDLEDAIRFRVNIQSEADNLREKVKELTTLLHESYLSLKEARQQCDQHMAEAESLREKAKVREEQVEKMREIHVGKVKDMERVMSEAMEGTNVLGTEIGEAHLTIQALERELAAAHSREMELEKLETDLRLTTKSKLTGAKDTAAIHKSQMDAAQDKIKSLQSQLDDALKGIKPMFPWDGVVSVSDLKRVFDSEAWAGTLSVGDFERLLNQLGLDGRTIGLRLFTAFDQDQNGFLDFRELFVGMSILLSVSTEQRLESAFMMMDTNSSGRVSITELDTFLRNIAPRTVPTHEVMALSEQIRREADVNRSGLIDYREFLMWPGKHMVLEWIDAYHGTMLARFGTTKGGLKAELQMGRSRSRSPGLAEAEGQKTNQELVMQLERMGEVLGTQRAQIEQMTENSQECEKMLKLKITQLESMLKDSQTKLSITTIQRDELLEKEKLVKKEFEEVGIIVARSEECEKIMAGELSVAQDKLRKLHAELAAARRHRPDVFVTPWDGVSPVHLKRAFDSEAWAGTLSVGDFERLLNQLGLDGRTIGLRLFTAFDQDQNGFLDFRELFVGMSILLSVSTEQRLESAFMMMDTNSSGRVSITELDTFLRNIAPRTVPTHEVMALSEQIRREADVNRSGLIDYREFLMWPGKHMVLEWIDAYHGTMLARFEGSKVNNLPNRLSRSQSPEPFLEGLSKSRLYDTPSFKADTTASYKPKQRGPVSQSPFGAVHGKPRLPMPASFDDIDKNGDGVIDRGEWAAVQQKKNISQFNAVKQQRQSQRETNAQKSRPTIGTAAAKPKLQPESSPFPDPRSNRKKRLASVQDLIEAAVHGNVPKLSNLLAMGENGEMDWQYN